MKRRRRVVINVDDVSGNMDDNADDDGEGDGGDNCGGSDVIGKQLR